jgi:hypothetical protein
MTAEGGKVVEVRPGEPVFQQLFDVAQGTAGSLNAIWDQVGCTTDERRQHLEGGLVVG